MYIHTFMNVTTSIPLEVYNLAREKRIKWSEALVRGIKSMNNEELPPLKGESFEESDKAKLIKAQKSMQRVIDDLNDKLEAKNG